MLGYSPAWQFDPFTKGDISLGDGVAASLEKLTALCQKFLHAIIASIDSCPMYDHQP